MPSGVVHQLGYNKVNLDNSYIPQGMCHYQAGVRTKNIAKLKDAERTLSRAVELNDKHLQAKGTLSEIRRLINAAEKRER